MIGNAVDGTLDELAIALTDTGTKTYRNGTDRTTSPAETVRAVAPLLPRCGITRIANITGLDVIGIPVMLAIRPNGRSLSTSQGKGTTYDAARASAVMEAIELYHAESATLSLKYNSYNELRSSGHWMSDVYQLPRSSTKPLDLDQPMPWVLGLNLVDHSTRWLPFELVHTDYRLPARLSSGIFSATSNGLASGNTFTEAVLHGLCEVVERDATTLARLSSADVRRGRRLDLTSVEDSSCAELIRQFSAAGIATAVWETTTEIGLPSFMCTIVGAEPAGLGSLHAASGMGCHPDRAVALSRALTEAAQSRLTMISGSRDDVPPDAYLRLQNNAVLLHVQQEVAAPADGVRFGSVPTFDHPTLAADLAVVLERLVAIGVDEVLAVNLARAELGVPVVRVVAPGLEGMAESPGYLLGARARARATS